MPFGSPVAVIQKQLDAYNAKDIEGWLSTYAQEAEQYILHGEPGLPNPDDIKS